MTTAESLTRLRDARAEDLRSIREVHLHAFGGPSEAKLVDLLHEGGKAESSIVAEQDGRIVGHVIFSAVTIEPERQSFRAAGLGPVGVLPAYQNRGIGSRLVREEIAACRDAGYDAVVVLGDPRFYARFGFAPAMSRGIGNEYVDDGHFMVLELREGALEGVAGLIRYAPEFQAAGC